MDAARAHGEGDGDVPRILVVDNEEGILEVCSDTLARLDGGATVVLEPSSPRAAERLAREPFDLLITNLTMPGLSGVRLLERARAAQPDLPAIVITGYPSRETAERCRRLGAVDYVRKPFHPDELLGIVRGVLKARARLRAARPPDDGATDDG